MNIRGSHKASMKSKSPKIAIIGAGLTGLSAAYYLRQRCPEAHVKIFEREDRIGGRVFTSHRPMGEHGAEFLLDSENAFLSLLRKVNVEHTPAINSWPGYFFRGRFAKGKPSKAAKRLLPNSANRLPELFKLAKDKRLWPKANSSFDIWLASLLQNDSEAFRFVEMLLLSKTCAPLSAISTEHGLECLKSLLQDKWFRIKGGSEKLVQALFFESNAYLKRKAEVLSVQQKHKVQMVQVHWSHNAQKEMENFQVVIVTTPTHNNFGGYISVLLEYRRRPRLKANPNFDLKRGLYDERLSYIQQIPTLLDTPYVIRILIPNASAKCRWSNQRIRRFCLNRLKKIVRDCDKPCDWSVQKWPSGLSLGNDKGEGFLRVGSSLIFLAGDRFVHWPSMDEAIKSGRKVAKKVASLL